MLRHTPVFSTAVPRNLRLPWEGIVVAKSLKNTDLSPAVARTPVNPVLTFSILLQDLSFFICVSSAAAIRSRSSRNFRSSFSFALFSRVTWRGRSLKERRRELWRTSKQEAEICARVMTCLRFSQTECTQPLTDNRNKFSHVLIYCGHLCLKEFDFLIFVLHKLPAALFSLLQVFYMFFKSHQVSCHFTSLRFAFFYFFDQSRSARIRFFARLLQLRTEKTK